MAYINGNSVAYGVYDDDAGKILDRSVKNIYNDEVKTIGDYAFYNCQELVSARFPQATNVTSHAFSGCRNLAQVQFKPLVSVSTSSFSDCESLTNIDLSRVEGVGVSAFQNCKQIKALSLRAVRNISRYAFSGCTQLSTVEIYTLPNLDNVNAFPEQTIIKIPNGNRQYFETATNWAVLFNSGRIKPLDGEW